MQSFTYKHRVTVLGCICADGKSYCLCLVLKGQRESVPNFNGKPTKVGEIMNGAWIVLYRPELASIDTTQFFDWAKLFTKKIREHISTEYWLVMFYDGLREHISLQVVKLFLDAKIVIMALPAHTSHRLQPLDVSVFGSLKHFIRTYLSKRASEFLSHGIRHEHNLGDICAAIKYGHNASFTVQNINSAFKRT